MSVHPTAFLRRGYRTILHRGSRLANRFAGVGNLRLADVQHFEPFEAAKQIHGGVGDLRLPQFQTDEILYPAQVLERHH